MACEKSLRELSERSKLPRVINGSDFSFTQLFSNEKVIWIGKGTGLEYSEKKFFWTFPGSEIFPPSQGGVVFTPPYI
jgi:hypothetical protein